MEARPAADFRFRARAPHCFRCTRIFRDRSTHAGMASWLSGSDVAPPPCYRTHMAASIIISEEKTWAAGAHRTVLVSCLVGQCSMTNGVGSGELRQAAQQRSPTQNHIAPQRRSRTLCEPPAATRLANRCSFRPTCECEHSICLHFHSPTCVERCSGGHQWANRGHVGAYNPADG